MRSSDADANNPSLWGVALGYGIYCALSLASRVVYPIFGLVVLMGIAAPLLWARSDAGWPFKASSRWGLGKTLLWGTIAGAVSSVAGLAVLDQRRAPDDLARQLLIALPFWVLVISPFQEFFFRGWMQSGLSEALGPWWALIVANAAFTLWHYLSPIVDMATFPLGSAMGLTSTFVAGLAYGYAFLRSDSIVAPWLAHTISGIVFVIAGAMDFVQALG